LIVELGFDFCDGLFYVLWVGYVVCGGEDVYFVFFVYDFVGEWV